MGLINCQQVDYQQLDCNQGRATKTAQSGEIGTRSAQFTASGRAARAGKLPMRPAAHENSNSRGYYGAIKPALA
jgi:hypothetical protein